jgi:transcription initiation factor IIF auxiliary subunit
VIKSPPFEVIETGYAGFSIPITLAFNGTFQQYNITYDMNLTMGSLFSASVCWHSICNKVRFEL